MSDTKVLRLVKKSEGGLPEGAFTAKSVAKAEPKRAPMTSPVLKVAPSPKPSRRRGKAKPQTQTQVSPEEMLKIFRTMYTVAEARRQRDSDEGPEPHFLSD
jgi:hypothetical protein